MFPDFKYYWAIRSLNTELSRTAKKNAAIVDTAKKEGKSKDDLYALRQELIFEEWEIEDRISQLESRHLCKEATRYRIPLPPHEDEDLWELSERSFVGYFLTQKGYSELRAVVRKEKNERWQSLALRLQVLGPLLAGLTGAIGALIGLLSIWLKLSQSN